MQAPQCLYREPSELMMVGIAIGPHPLWTSSAAFRSRAAQPGASGFPAKQGRMDLANRLPKDYP